MKKKSLFFSVLSFLVFIIFTVIVKFFDVAALGETNTEVGFSTLNGFFYNSLKDSSYAGIWLNISEYLGYVALLVPVVFALIGFIQIIKKKKLSLVDKRLFCLAGFYVAVLFFYVIFEKIIINYRPIFVDGVIEASYPSSHTLLSICLIGSSVIFFKRFITDKKPYVICYNCISLIFILLIVAGRLMSSMHWFTDIIGAVLLSSSLISLLYFFVKEFE